MTPIDTLWRLESRLEIWLVVFTALVGVGVVMEEWEHIRELWCAIFEYFKGGIPFNKSSFKWSAVGGTMVIFGLAGEGVIEVWTPIVETQIRATMAGRELTAEQQRKIGAALARFSGNQVWLRSYKGDSESKKLGREIISALHLANIKTEDRLEELYSGPMMFGIEVHCTVNRVEDQRPLGNALIGALSGKDGGNLEVAPTAPTDCAYDGPFEIWIGIKPPTLVN
jgi:hypothetical protein